MDDEQNPTHKGDRKTWIWDKFDSRAGFAGGVPLEIPDRHPNSREEECRERWPQGNFGQTH